MISILCPTRYRPHKLRRLVQSIVGTSDSREDYELILRMHSDDAQTISLIPELLPLGPIVVIVGKPHTKWIGHVQCFTEAARIAAGDWFWVMNDDCVLEGNGWAKAVQEAPANCMCFPQKHRLGGSTYQNDSGCPMAISPRELWLETTGQLSFPGDTFILERARILEMTHYFMEGITVWHDRTEPSEYS